MKIEIISHIKRTISFQQGELGRGRRNSKNKSAADQRRPFQIDYTTDGKVHNYLRRHLDSWHRCHFTTFDFILSNVFANINQFTRYDVLWCDSSKDDFLQ